MAERFACARRAAFFFSFLRVWLGACLGRPGSFVQRLGNRLGFVRVVFLCRPRRPALRQRLERPVQGMFQLRPIAQDGVHPLGRPQGGAVGVVAAGVDGARPPLARLGQRLDLQGLDPPHPPQGEREPLDQRLFDGALRVVLGDEAIEQGGEGVGVLVRQQREALRAQAVLGGVVARRRLALGRGGALAPGAVVAAGLDLGLAALAGERVGVGCGHAGASRGRGRGAGSVADTRNLFKKRGGAGRVGFGRPGRSNPATLDPRSGRG